VGGWYDCGKLDTLLETNEILLRKGAALRQEFPGVTLHDPVRIEEGVRIERSEIGPNVTLERGADVRDSRIRHSIVGRKSTVVKSDLHHSMLGDRVAAIGLKGFASLGDDSEVTIE